MIPGNNGLPKIDLKAADGAQAEVYLHGGHVTSWIPAGDTERLFLSSRAEFKPSAAFRGGIPVIFPQFAGRGSLPKHGFARTSEFQLHMQDNHWVTLQLQNNEATQQVWPHAFGLQITVLLEDKELTVNMSVINEDEQPFTFTGALHTYLQVSQLDEVIIEGLGGKTYEDHTAGGAEKVQTEDLLRIVGEVDRLYRDVLNPVFLREPGRGLQVSAEGFPDVVVWNPGAEKAVAMSDLAPGDERQFVCIEAAAVASPVTLAPGEVWEGSQILRVV